MSGWSDVATRVTNLAATNPKRFTALVISVILVLILVIVIRRSHERDLGSKPEKQRVGQQNTGNNNQNINLNNGIVNQVNH